VPKDFENSARAVNVIYSSSNLTAKLKFSLRPNSCFGADCAEANKSSPEQ
jgi:hypothetical protein